MASGEEQPAVSAPWAHDTPTSAGAHLQECQQAQAIAGIATSNAAEHDVERQRGEHVEREPATQITPGDVSRVAKQLACARRVRLLPCIIVPDSRSELPVLSTRPVKKLSAMSTAKTAVTASSKRERTAPMGGLNAVSYGTAQAV